jgi:precorrin isomerase
MRTAFFGPTTPIMGCHFVQYLAAAGHRGGATVAVATFNQLGPPEGGRYKS